MKSFTILGAALIVVAVGVAYSNSFSGVFLLDDSFHIESNPRVQELLPLGETLGGRRPVVDLTLAANLALGGLDVRGYHAFNLIVHLLASLALFGVVRRTLRGQDGVALVAALIWALHPLQTESVTYVIQRAESMTGLFYLLTLYCVIRGAASERRAGWFGAAVAACALGMGSKAVMATAPVVVLLYDRSFIAQSFAEALRRRWLLYCGLAATWTVLLATGAAGGLLRAEEGWETSGFGYAGLTPWEYLRTQPGVLLHYLKLSLWPDPLCLDYVWPVAGTAGKIVPAAALVVALLVLTGWALYRRKAVGFLGAFFFLVLAPSSSIVPLSDLLVEHRMYLPLAALAVAAAAGVRALTKRPGSRLQIALAMLVSVLLAYGTYQRNEIYGSSERMWRDVLETRPENARAHSNLGNELVRQGRLDEGAQHLEQAARLLPDSPLVLGGLGEALVKQGRLQEAVGPLERAVERDPSFVAARRNLAYVLVDLERMDEAAAQLSRLLEASPDDARAHHKLGRVRLAQGRVPEAATHVAAAVRLQPDSAEMRTDLGMLRFMQGRTEEAIAELQRARQLAPDYHLAHHRLGVVLLESGRAAAAAREFRAALAIDPTFAPARRLLAQAEQLPDDR